jgi:hypothetical protein
MNHKVPQNCGISWLRTYKLLTKVTAPCSSFLFVIIRILNAEITFWRGPEKSVRFYEGPAVPERFRETGSSLAERVAKLSIWKPATNQTAYHHRTMNLPFSQLQHLTTPAQFYFKPLFVWTTHSTNTLHAFTEQYMAPLCWIHDPSPFTSKSFHNDPSAGTHQTHDVCIAGLIPQSPQLQAQVRSASLCWCHKSGKCAMSCASRSACCCSQSGGASIGLIT